jgi:hypothetical protein
MASGNANPRVTTLLLAVTGIETLVLFGAGVGLVVQPTVISSIWPWPLTPFNAAFLGAVYSASLVSAAALTVIGRWSPARIVLPMILVFTTIVLFVSLAHLGRFSPGWPAWLWFFLYLALPINAARHVWLYRDLPPADPEPPTPGFRAVLLIAAAIFGLYGLALLAAPEAVGNLWPWPIDAFHGRLYSVTFLTPAIGLYLLGRAASWAELWTMGLTLLVLGLLAIFGLAVTDVRTDRIDWAGPSTWSYVVPFGLVVALGFGLCRAAQQRKRPSGPLAADGLFIPPRWLALVFGIAFVIAGVAAFLPVFTHPMPADAPHLHVDAAYGLLIGLYPVNLIHSLFHLAVGLLGIAAFVRPFFALSYIRGFAIVLAGLTLMGLLPGLDTLFGLAPLFSHDIWLHGIEALAAGYVGWIMGAPGRSSDGRGSRAA